MKNIKGSIFGGAEGLFVAVDKMQNVYVTGSFYDTATFGSIILTNGTMNGNSFLVKYDSNGNAIWARSATITNGSVISYSVSNDDSDYVYITGGFSGTISFGSTILTNSNNSCAFLTKYDSIGNVVWAKSATVKKRSSCYGLGITTDHLGGIYITGDFKDSIAFDTANMVSITSQFDVFIVKYAANGQLLWTKEGYFPSRYSFIDINSDNLEYITIDNSNNVYVCGTYFDTIGFGSYLLNTDTNVLNPGAFLVKYAANGALLWAESSGFGGVSYSISVDKSNNVYWTGGCYDSLFSIAGLILNSTPGNLEFLVKLDSNGKGFCGTTSNIAPDDYTPIATDPLGNNVYMGGDINNGLPFVAFGNDTVFYKKNSGEYGFLTKWNSCSDIITNAPQSKNIENIIDLFPNPNTGKFTLESSNRNMNSTIEIYNILGEKVFTEPLSSQNKNAIKMGSQPSGVYLYRVISENGSLIGEGKFVIQQ
ncbi:MAG TPA: T9SS type A sorting domain-containing protein [Bacteroidia bacterium]|nr:T9SS type A sorting domain-containing protein [Bacteroidia bacterium]